MTCCQNQPITLLPVEASRDVPLTAVCCPQPTSGEQLLSPTESVCPVCLTRLPAQRVRRGDEVYLEKSCPQHGPFQTIIWRGLHRPAGNHPALQPALPGLFCRCRKRRSARPRPDRD
jgi:hypothetical protein